MLLNSMLMMGCGVGGVPPTPVNTYAAQFTVANNEFLSRANESLLQTGDIDFSWCGWIKLDTKTSYRHFITKYHNDAGAVGEFALMYHNTPDRFRFLVWGGGANRGLVNADTFGSPATGTWYFIYAYHDSVNDLVGISINNGTADTSATTGAVTTSIAALRLGGSQWDGSTPTGTHDGGMQSVGFAKSLLSGATLSSLYNSGVPKGWCQLTSGEKALFTGWWDLGETSGDRSDSTSNALTLTDNNTVTQVAGTRTGNCL